MLREGCCLLQPPADPRRPCPLPPAPWHVDPEDLAGPWPRLVCRVGGSAVGDLATHEDRTPVPLVQRAIGAGQCWRKSLVRICSCWCSWWRVSAYQCGRSSMQAGARRLRFTPRARTRPGGSSSWLRRHVWGSDSSSVPSTCCSPGPKCIGRWVDLPPPWPLRRRWFPTGHGPTPSRPGTQTSTSV